MSTIVFAQQTPASSPPSSSSASAAGQQAGAIKIANIQNEVSLVTPTGQVPLTNGQILTEHSRIRTGSASSVVLVFANGSTIKLGPSTEMEVAEFRMEPLKTEVKVSELTEEPTTSTTRLKLDKGELIGDVKKLKRDRGSSFSVQTPVGAAGIRGTTFRIVFMPPADGGRAFTFQINTSEGVVAFTGTVASGTQLYAALQQAAGTGSEVSVSALQEIVVTGQVDLATNQVTEVTVPTASQTISAAAQAAIETAVTQIIQAAQQSTTLTLQDQQSAALQSQTSNTTATGNTTSTEETTATGNTTSTGNTTATGNTTTTTTAQTPPPAQTSTPRVTSGDGR